MHRYSDTVTRYSTLLTRTWDHLSDHHQLDTDRATRILDLQTQLERLDIRLLADPADTDTARRLEQTFSAIDVAVDTVRDYLDPDDPALRILRITPAHGP